MSRKSIGRKFYTGLLSLLVLALLTLPLMVQPARQLIFLKNSGDLRHMSAESARLERLIFTADEFAALKFVRPGREFVYLGNQYDVFSITRSGNQVLVTALWDSAETSILKVLALHDSQNDSTQPGVSKFGFMPYFSIDPFRVSFCQPRPLLSYSLLCLPVYKSLSLPVFTPPPELLTRF